MSDIQRWHLQGLPGTTGIVDVMSYADHVADVEEAYQLGRTDGILLGEEKAHRDSVIVHEGAAERRGYLKGVSAERARIRTAVDEMFLRLPFTEFQVGYCTGLRDVKTKAIDGVEES